MKTRKRHHPAYFLSRMENALGRVPLALDEIEVLYRGSQSVYNMLEDLALNNPKAITPEVSKKSAELFGRMAAHLQKIAYMHKKSTFFLDASQTTLERLKEIKALAEGGVAGFNRALCHLA